MQKVKEVEETEWAGTLRLARFAGDIESAVRYPLSLGRVLEAVLVAELRHGAGPKPQQAEATKALAVTPLDHPRGGVRIGLYAPLVL